VNHSTLGSPEDNPLIETEVHCCVLQVDDPAIIRELARAKLSGNAYVAVFAMADQDFNDKEVRHRRRG